MAILQALEQIASEVSRRRPGDVTGQLVYANYGLPEDYAYLKSRNIDIKGKIVIVRYGHTWRIPKAALLRTHDE